MKTHFLKQMKDRFLIIINSHKVLVIQYIQINFEICLKEPAEVSYEFNISLWMNPELFCSLCCARY